MRIQWHCIPSVTNFSLFNKHYSTEKMGPYLRKIWVLQIKLICIQRRFCNMNKVENCVSKGLRRRYGSLIWTKCAKLARYRPLCCRQGSKLVFSSNMVTNCSLLVNRWSSSGYPSQAIKSSQPTFLTAFSTASWSLEANGCSWPPKQASFPTNQKNKTKVQSPL